MASSGEYVDGEDLDLILQLLDEDFFEDDESFQSHIDSFASEVSWIAEFLLFYAKEDEMQNWHLGLL